MSRMDRPFRTWALCRRPLAYLGVIALVAIVEGRALAQEPSPRSIAEAFLAGLQRGQTSASLDRLFSGSSIPKDKPQQVDLLRRQLEAGLPAYGKVLGFELVREEKFGTSIVRLVYLLKSEKHATVWEFHFYKPQANWFLANLNFNDQFNGLR